MRVIGIGLNKTGTTSLGKAVEILGFKKHHSWDTENVIDYSNGKIDELLKFTKDYNNLEDMPWFLIYKELNEYYDDAMFVLTTRKSAEIWYKSQCKHYDKNMKLEGYDEETAVTNQIVYGYENPYLHREEFIAKYHQHNEEVREYFNGKDNFVELCWEDGDGWKELCAFLQIPSPEYLIKNKSFIHANKSLRLKDKILKKIKYFVKLLF